MKSRWYQYLLLGILFLSFSSCEHTITEEDEYTSLGEIGEMAVYSDPETLGTLNDPIRECLAPKITGLSAPEPAFKLRIPTDGVLKGYHKKNFVLFVLVHQNNWIEIREQFDQKIANTVNKFVTKGNDTSFMITDAWSKPQKVVFCVSKDIESMGKFLINKKEGLFETALRAERQSTIARLYKRRKEVDDFYQGMMNDRGYAYRKPFKYAVSVSSDTFVGFKRYFGEKELGVYSHFEKYKGRYQFTKNYVIKRRNEMLKRHVHGPDRKDSLPTYLSTEDEKFVTITHNETEINGQFAVETRGWTTMVNGYYGGPFVTYTIYSEKLQQVVTVEGQVYAPNENVARYMREVELIAHTYEENQ